jgi:hypothetical protein
LCRATMPDRPLRLLTDSGVCIDAYNTPQLARSMQTGFMPDGWVLAAHAETLVPQPASVSTSSSRACSARPSMNITFMPSCRRGWPPAYALPAQDVATRRRRRSWMRSGCRQTLTWVTPGAAWDDGADGAERRPRSACACCSSAALARAIARRDARVGRVAGHAERRGYRSTLRPAGGSPREDRPLARPQSLCIRVPSCRAV